MYKNFSMTRLYKEEKCYIFFSSCYVIWCFVSLIWSDDVSRGLQLSGRNITILLFPIFISLARIGGVIKEWDILIWAFFAGTLVSSFICIYLSYQDCWYEIDGNIVFSTDIWQRNVTAFEAFGAGRSYFSYIFLSHFTHPAYFSLHFIFVLVFLINKLWNTDDLKTKIIIIVSIIYCSVFVFLLQCRAELICLAVCLISSLFFYSFERKCFKLLVFGLCFTIVVAIIIVPYTRLNGLINGARMSLDRLENQDIETPIIKENENVRVFLWKNAYEVIKRQPILGVGVGDADLVMQRENEKNKFPIASLCVHNQYLYSWLALGCVGFLFLLAMLLSSLFYGIKNRYFPLLGFTIALMIGIMFESMLSRRVGIMFIPLAIQLLMIMSKERNVHNDK